MGCCYVGVLNRDRCVFSWFSAFLLHLIGFSVDVIADYMGSILAIPSHSVDVWIFTSEVIRVFSGE